MVECIRCNRQVKRLMKSTGTCRKCRDEEIRDNRDRMLEEDGDIMLDSAKALYGIQKEMEKNKEPDEAGWEKIEDFEYENEYTYDDEDVKEFDRIITRCESQNQMERIEGRMEYKKFASRFTKKELKEMGKKIGCDV